MWRGLLLLALWLSAGNAYAQPEYTASPSAALRTSPSAALTATPTGEPTITSGSMDLCKGMRVTAGNNQVAPTTVDFAVEVSLTVTKLRYHFGDGEVVESVNKNISHEYARAGEYEVYAEVQEERGGYVSPRACAVKVTLMKAPLTKEGLGCNELVVAGDRKAATVSATLTVKGYGAVKGYKVAYDDGTTEEATGSGVFTRTYEKPGTYLVKGFVRGDEGAWLGGDGACRRYVYVYTAGMTSQPQTGVSTGVWVALLAAMLSGMGLWRLAALKAYRGD